MKATVAVLVVAWSTSDVSAATQDPAIADAMRGHYAEALQVHAAVIRGDVPAAGRHARILADRLAQTPASGSPAALEALAAAARDVRDATGVLSAAQATATMLGACGRCHRASGVTPMISPPAREESAGLTAQMREHKAAADQLLVGLIVPSDSAWRTGARTLGSATLQARDLPLGPTLQPQVGATEERLHRLARDAVQTTDPRTRAGFYAQFLAGCADCHRRYEAFRKPR